jgi:hypothetical protein
VGAKIYYLANARPQAGFQYPVQERPVLLPQFPNLPPVAAQLFAEGEMDQRGNPVTPQDVLYGPLYVPLVHGYVVDGQRRRPGINSHQLLQVLFLQLPEQAGPNIAGGSGNCYDPGGLNHGPLAEAGLSGIISKGGSTGSPRTEKEHRPFVLSLSKDDPPGIQKF